MFDFLCDAVGEFLYLVVFHQRAFGLDEVNDVVACGAALLGSEQQTDGCACYGASDHC